MIEVLKQQFTPDMTPEDKLNRTREFLQIIALKIMYDKGVFDNIAFTGGTALRILFNLRRFSEDLDFSLISKKGYNFEKINQDLIYGLKLYGLDVESRPETDKNVHSSFLKFSGLLKELGFSPLKGQKISVKVEVDTNPPAGGKVEKTIVNKVYMLGITHFDLPSMFSTKLSACFYRKYTKGRDFYDLVWYLSKGIKPNFRLLNNAIKQIEGSAPRINEENFKDFLLNKIDKVDFSLVRKDVERFLEDKSELKLLDKKIIKDNIRKLMYRD